MVVIFIILLSFFERGTFHHDMVKVGDTQVIIQQQENGEGKTFIHLHQSEKTALKAARTIVRQEGGCLRTLIHSGSRNIIFTLNKKQYEFDPNRIFTDAGIKKTLAEFSDYTPQAATEVKKLAYKIKALLPKGKIIAVHNNETYSMLNYYPGHDLAPEAHSMHINKDHFYRNFFLVTQQQDFIRLKKYNFNSILQAGNAMDDGSLSIFLANRAYINVEAGYDELAMQIKMLRHA